MLGLIQHTLVPTYMTIILDLVVTGTMKGDQGLIDCYPNVTTDIDITLYYQQHALLEINLTSRGGSCAI